MYSTADSGVACTIRASKASGSFAPRMRVRALAAYDAATESIFSTRPEKGSSLRYRLISSEKVYAKAGVRPLSPTSDRADPDHRFAEPVVKRFCKPGLPGQGVECAAIEPDKDRGKRGKI